jgi:hypothetical protein
MHILSGSIIHEQSKVACGIHTTEITAEARSPFLAEDPSTLLHCIIAHAQRLKTAPISTFTRHVMQFQALLIREYTVYA